MAGRQQLKRVPGLRRTYHGWMRVRREVAAAAHGARSGVLTRLLTRRRRRLAFSRQAVLEVNTLLPTISGPQHLISWLQEQGIAYSEGAFTVYIPPGPGIRAILGDEAERYPRDAGLKLLKIPGVPGTARYVPPTPRDLDASVSYTWSAALLTPRATDLLLGANALALHEIGPRPYDLVALKAGDSVLTAFVVAHVGEASPSPEACEDLIGRIQGALDRDQLGVTVGAWRDHSDFRCPDCNGNALARIDGVAQYVDFQNFVVPDQGKLVRATLEGAETELHFGRQSSLRGGRYLYQSLPHISRGGKRDSLSRWRTIEGMLGSVGTSLSGRPVLDIGCNAGLFMAGSLGAGAEWAYGWDTPQVAARARALLLALGLTRFDVFGADLARAHPLGKDMEAGGRRAPSDAVVFYLAIRHHIGFLDALRAVEWTTLVYEGAEFETLGEIEETLAPLTGIGGVTIAEAATVRGGESAPRPIAVLERRPVPQPA